MTAAIVDTPATPSVGSCERDRATSDEHACVTFHGITRDAPPEKVQQIEIAMVDVHAGATELDHFAAKWFVRRKIKFPLAVITEIRRRQLASLQPIRADNFARREFFDDKVIAELIEWIDIEAESRATSASPSPSSRLKTSNRNCCARRTSSALCASRARILDASASRSRSICMLSISVFNCVLQ